MAKLADNVAKLPSAAMVKRVRVATIALIENAPGKQASVAIYTYLARKYGGCFSLKRSPHNRCPVRFLNA